MEPPDVFCSLGSLIVEGRLPRPGQSRGCGEGPHVPPPNLHGGPALAQRHHCSQENYLVSEFLRIRHTRGFVGGPTPAVFQCLLLRNAFVQSERAADRPRRRRLLVLRFFPLLCHRLRAWVRL